MPKKIDYNKWLTGAGIVVGVLIVYKTFQKFGILPTDTDIKTDNYLTNPGSYWKPAYYKKVGGTILKRETAENFAKKINSSFTFLYDDSASILGVFYQLKTKSQVSYLADVFYQLYNLDLLNTLRVGSDFWPMDGMSESNLKKLIGYTDKLAAK